MVASPVVLILGAGSNIGASVARAFALKGYKVAVTSRQPPQDHDNDDYLRVQGDLSDPNSVQHTFATVRSVLGHPSVVVYNGERPDSLAVTPKTPKLSGDSTSRQEHRQPAKGSTGAASHRHARRSCSQHC